MYSERVNTLLKFIVYKGNSKTDDNVVDFMI